MPKNDEVKTKNFTEKDTGSFCEPNTIRGLPQQQQKTAIIETSSTAYESLQAGLSYKFNMMAKLVLVAE